MFLLLLLLLCQLNLNTVFRGESIDGVTGATGIFPLTVLDVTKPK